MQVGNRYHRFDWQICRYFFSINQSENIFQVNQGNGMGCASFNDGYVPAGGYSYNTPAERDGKSTVPSPPDALWQQENGLAQSAYSNSVDDGDMPVGSDLNGLNVGSSFITFYQIEINIFCVLGYVSAIASIFALSAVIVGWTVAIAESKLLAATKPGWPQQQWLWNARRKHLEQLNGGWNQRHFFSNRDHFSIDSSAFQCVPSPIVQPFVHPQPAMTTPWPSQDVNYTQGDCLNGYRNNGIIGCGMPIRSISTYNQMVSDETNIIFSRSGTIFWSIPLLFFRPYNRHTSSHMFSPRSMPLATITMKWRFHHLEHIHNHSYSHRRVTRGRCAETVQQHITTLTVMDCHGARTGQW